MKRRSRCIRCATSTGIRVATRPPGHLCPKPGRSRRDMPGGQRRGEPAPFGVGSIPTSPLARPPSTADADRARHHLLRTGQSGGRAGHGPSHSDAAGLHPPPPDRVDPTGHRLRQSGSRRRRASHRPTAGPGQRSLHPWVDGSYRLPMVFTADQVSRPERRRAAAPAQGEHNACLADGMVTPRAKTSFR